MGIGSAKTSLVEGRGSLSGLHPGRSNDFLHVETWERLLCSECSSTDSSTTNNQ